MRCGADQDALADGIPAHDWDVLIDYLTGSDTPEAHAHTEHRLATDPAFAEFARPVIMLWNSPLSPSTPEYNLEAGWATIQRKAAAMIAARSKLR